MTRTITDFPTVISDLPCKGSVLIYKVASVFVMTHDDFHVFHCTFAAKIRNGTDQ